MQRASGKPVKAGHQGRQDTKMAVAYGKVVLHTPNGTNGRPGHPAPLLTAASTDCLSMPGSRLRSNPFRRKSVHALPRR